jgi:hypothetical protein
MNDCIAKQDKLDRLYGQILKIDEDGKDFLKAIIIQAEVNQVYRPREERWPMKRGLKRGLRHEWGRGAKKRGFYAVPGRLKDGGRMPADTCSAEAVHIKGVMRNKN